MEVEAVPEQPDVAISYVIADEQVDVRAIVPGRQELGNVDVEVALERKDTVSQHRVFMATQAKELLIAAFKARGLRDVQEYTTTDNKLTLHIKITRCSEGSRLGRYCFAQYGVGWALLHLEWRICDDRTHIVVVGPFTEKLRHSAALGCADMCDDRVGDMAIQDMAASRGPIAIEKKISKALPFVGASSRQNVVETTERN